MQDALLAVLRARRPDLRSGWETGLRAQPVLTPLGHPDALVHLINWTLDEVFAALASPLTRRRSGGTRALARQRYLCPCGRNPLLNYFAAGKRALQSALAAAADARPELAGFERAAALAELNLVIQRIARREIAAFCGVCQFRRSSMPARPVQALAVHGR
jgi:hypothetical protein